jgi:hypothetical protein
MDYKRLSQEERLAARNRAIETVKEFAGAMPNRDHFKHSQQSEYPAWLRGLIVGLALVVLLTAFILSAMRLYDIGHRTFAVSINHDLSATVAGAAIVTLAEAASVLFTLAYSVLGKTPVQRQILAASVVGTACLALSGNFYVALYGHPLTAFTVLEAMLPPLLTLSTAYVLKALMLDEIAARHADELAYQGELAQWRLATSNPDQHSDYPQIYANELWDALLKANNRKEAVKGWLLSLDSRGKTRLVQAEMLADSWLDQQALLLPATLPDYEIVEGEPFLAGAGS